VKNEFAYIVKETHSGMGGFPLPTQEDVLSLMSGGFDSSVSTYLMMRKARALTFCFLSWVAQPMRLA
jgi:thiamine biosynthesis protein ThiI